MSTLYSAFLKVTHCKGICYFLQKLFPKHYTMFKQALFHIGILLYYWKEDVNSLMIFYVKIYG